MLGGRDDCRSTPTGLLVARDQHLGCRTHRMIPWPHGKLISPYCPAARLKQFYFESGDCPVASRRTQCYQPTGQLHQFSALPAPSSSGILIMVDGKQG